MEVRTFCERWLVNGIEEDYKNWLPRGVERHQKRHAFSSSHQQERARVHLFSISCFPLQQRRIITFYIWQIGLR